MSLGIYIQVPFCRTKCTYCNFHAGPASRALYTPYAAAVEKEIREYQTLCAAANLDLSAELASAAVDTIYIGGGTPSLLECADLSRLIQAVRARFAHQLQEVTLEADPETITAEKCAAWRKAGINRISMGAQSFQDQELIAAGRLHRRPDIFTAWEHLRAAGFGNISLDLIAGLARQTEPSWRRSVRDLIQLRPEHVSIYLLEIDHHSRLGREVLSSGRRYGAGSIPSEDAMADFYDMACAELAAAGYEHYELSNWALPGFRSLHNSKYWRRQPYLGFGAGAHSFDGRRRWANAHDPASYLQAVQNGSLPLEQRQDITASQALEEEFFLGLRQLEGIDLDRLERLYQVRLAPRIEPLLRRGLIERRGSFLRLSPQYLTVSNEVFAALLD